MSCPNLAVLNGTTRTLPMVAGYNDYSQPFQITSHDRLAHYSDSFPDDSENMVCDLLF